MTTTASRPTLRFEDPESQALYGAIYAAAINTQYKGGPWSLASLYGGRMPERWGIVVVNDTGTALSATAGDHVFEWQGLYATAI